MTDKSPKSKVTIIQYIFIIVLNFVITSLSEIFLYCANTNTVTHNQHINTVQCKGRQSGYSWVQAEQLELVNR